MIDYSNKVSKEFKIKLLNLWFYEEPEELDLSPSMLNWAGNLLNLLMTGDDAVFSHPNIQEVFKFLQENCLVEESTTLMEHYFIGKISLHQEFRKVINSEEVSRPLASLLNIMG